MKKLLIVLAFYFFVHDRNIDQSRVVGPFKTLHGINSCQENREAFKKWLFIVTSRNDLNYVSNCWEG